MYILLAPFAIKLEKEIMPRLLIVDDEPNLAYSLQKSLQTDELEVVTAATARRGLETVEQELPDAIILDVRLPDMSGLEAFDRIRQFDPRVPVIVITAFAATETAIEAMKRGAFEYLLKPLDLYQLRKVVHQAIDVSRLRRVPAVYEQADAAGQPVDRIIGNSPAMQAVYKSIGRVAPQDVTVLLTGESGTGKELVARAIYHHSRRSKGPFLPINCAAIPEGLLESELFGHERGAFTGADRRRIGKFEQAQGGTVLLDEIGDMPTPLQAKILRLLQEQCFERVGGNETVKTDVRLIAVTNRNLEELVAQGKFRQDLYYRLNVFSIQLAPLRERVDDLPLIADHFIQMSNPALGKQIHPLAPEAVHALAAHSWPGNIRELNSVIKYAMLHATGDVLTPALLQEILRSRAFAAPLTKGGGLEISALIRQLLAARETDIYRKVCSAVDRVILEEVLQHAKGNQVQASEILGISRTTLRGKLQELGLGIEKQIQEKK
jgi:two-component system nitrogen regulation response regulator GlnG